MKPEGWEERKQPGLVLSVAGSSPAAELSLPRISLPDRCSSGEKSLHAPGEPLSLQAACTLPAGLLQEPCGHMNGDANFRGPLRS